MKPTTAIKEFEFTHKNGSTFWVEITASFFKDESKRTQLFGVMRNISKPRAIENERDDLLLKLEESLSQQKALEAENEMLRGLLSICSGYKKIRDENGKWWHVEEYVAMHSEADFFHAICPPAVNESTRESADSGRIISPSINAGGDTTLN